MNADETTQFLLRSCACDAVIEWAEGKDVRTIWDTCERGDWVMWLLNEVGYKMDDDQTAAVSEAMTAAGAKCDQAVQLERCACQRAVAKASARRQAIVRESLIACQLAPYNTRVTALERHRRIVADAQKEYRRAVVAALSMYSCATEKAWTEYQSSPTVIAARAAHWRTMANVIRSLVPYPEQLIEEVA